MSLIHPIVLCGGSGTRLWPMSRVSHPKQFHGRSGPDSLTFFQDTIQRHKHPGYGAPLVVTGYGHQATVRDQLHRLQANARVLVEPVARNTGPAVLASALRLVEEEQDAVMVVLPCDHVIKGDINSALLSMREAAEMGRIVLFGIVPTYPETGFGYIVDGGQFRNMNGLRRIDRFVEKPPRDVAGKLLATGHAYWASGISMFRASTLIEEYQRLDQMTFAHVKEAVARGEDTRNGFVLAEAPFSLANDKPTEQAVFERSPAIALAPVDVEWSDVGSWSALYDVEDLDEHGNVLRGDVIALNTRDCYIRSESRLVTALGVSDVVVVDTPDAVLITSRNETQRVKDVVNILKTKKRREVDHSIRRSHVWGESAELGASPSNQMTLLCIEPGSYVEVEDHSHQRILELAGSLVFDRFGGFGNALEVLPRLAGDDQLPVENPRTRIRNHGESRAEVLVVRMRGGGDTGDRPISFGGRANV